MPRSSPPASGQLVRQRAASASRPAAAAYSALLLERLRAAPSRVFRFAALTLRFAAACWTSLFFCLTSVDRLEQRAWRGVGGDVERPLARAWSPRSCSFSICRSDRLRLLVELRPAAPGSSSSCGLQLGLAALDAGPCTAGSGGLLLGLLRTSSSLAMIGAAWLGQRRVLLARGRSASLTSVARAACAGCLAASSASRRSSFRRAFSVFRSRRPRSSRVGRLGLERVALGLQRVGVESCS